VGLRRFRTLRTFSLGFPALVSEVSSGLVILVFNFLILGLAGNIGVAAYGVVANLSLVVLAIFTGLAQGLQPLVSQAHGQGDPDSQNDCCATR
jgi:Na+-driven multidrug efflux pump